MLVHRRVTPRIKFAGTHLYTWVKRGTVRVKCLAQEHNTMTPVRARTQTARSGVERTNHEALAMKRMTKTRVNLPLKNASISWHNVLYITGSSHANNRELKETTTATGTIMSPDKRKMALHVHYKSLYIS